MAVRMFLAHGINASREGQIGQSPEYGMYSSVITITSFTSYVDNP